MLKEIHFPKRRRKKAATTRRLTFRGPNPVTVEPFVLFVACLGCYDARPPTTMEIVNKAWGALSPTRS